YAGQGYEIAVPCTAEPLRVSELKALRIGFDQQHRSMFGHMAPEEPVEIVSYRVRGVGLVPPVEPPKFDSSGAALQASHPVLLPPCSLPTTARNPTVTSTIEINSTEDLTLQGCRSPSSSIARPSCVPARPRGWTNGRA